MLESNLTDIVIGTWFFCGVVVFVYNWLNVPVQFVFFCNRLTQLRDKNFDLRPTTPTHALIHYYCAILYGILIPAFFFATAHIGHELGPYFLGKKVCNDWMTLIGMICMAWLAVHIIHGIVTGDRLRFGGKVDLVFAAVGFAYCLWFHLWTIIEIQSTVSKFRNGPHTALGYAFFIAYEQTLILGATLVYGFALLEARRTPMGIAFAAGLRPRQWAWRAGVFMFALAPWWLSLPHNSHRQALDLIRQHRELIMTSANNADLDPGLIAGIIYVGQSRQHSRLTGDLMDSLGLEIDENGDIIREFSPILPYNDPVGLCRIRPRDWIIVKSRANSTNSLRLKWTPKHIGDDESHRYGLKAMLDPGENIKSSAMMLYLLRDQWRWSGFNAADQPEILATIFSQGIENSRPEKSPKPNDFGRRVKAFMESDDCRRALEGQ